jgi:hypothetical protein
MRMNLDETYVPRTSLMPQFNLSPVNPSGDEPETDDDDDTDDEIEGEEDDDEDEEDDDDETDFDEKDEPVSETDKNA